MKIISSYEMLLPSSCRYFPWSIHYIVFIFYVQLLHRLFSYWYWLQGSELKHSCQGTMYWLFFCSVNKVFGGKRQVCPLCYIFFFFCVVFIWMGQKFSPVSVVPHLLFWNVLPSLVSLVTWSFIWSVQCCLCLPSSIFSIHFHIPYFFRNFDILHCFCNWWWTEVHPRCSSFNSDMKNEEMTKSLKWINICSLSPY